MRTTSIIFLLFICLFNNVFLRKTNIPNKNVIPMQQIPQFPGGEDSLWCFLASNLRYDIINSDSESVRYIFRFVIDTLGQASNIEFMISVPRGITTKHDSLKKAEIIRVLKLLPRWKFDQNLPRFPVWWSIPINTPSKDFNCKKLKSDLRNPK